MSKTKSQLKQHMRDAVPYTTTFLFLEPGCEAVGQGTALQIAIEKAMKVRFDLWAETWINPLIEQLK